MKYDVITIGGTTEDINFYSNDGVVIDNRQDVLRQKLYAFEYGAKIKVDKTEHFFGGGASNAAVNLAGLGFKTATIVAIGEDSRGKDIIKNFKNKKVDTRLLQIIKGVETGYSVMLIGPSKEHVCFSNRASNNHLSLGEKQIEALKQSKWVYVSSLSGKWETVLKKVFSIPSLKVVWNPGNAQLASGYSKLATYLKRTELLILNKDESLELAMSCPECAGKDRKFLENVYNLLNALKSLGPNKVVVTCGEDGAYAFDGANTYYEPINKERKVADTTGVGDAYGSTLIAGLEFFAGDIQRAMNLSSLNTASVVETPGAQNGLLTKKDIIKFLK